jgi:hypothetical protein
LVLIYRFASQAISYMSAVPDDSFKRFGKLSTPSYLWFACQHDQKHRAINDVRVLYDDEKLGEHAMHCVWFYIVAFGFHALLTEIPSFLHVLLSFCVPEPGWEKIPEDLNKGIQGRSCYIAFKRLVGKYSFVLFDLPQGPYLKLFTIVVYIPSGRRA